MSIYNQAILEGLSRAPALKKQREQSNFNVGNALLPALAALIAAPFTGGTSLAALGTEAVRGGVMEGTRAMTAQDPMAQQIAFPAVQQIMGRMATPESKARDEYTEKLKATLMDSGASAGDVMGASMGDPEMMKMILPTILKHKYQTMDPFTKFLMMMFPDMASMYGGGGDVPPPPGFVED